MCTKKSVLMNAREFHYAFFVSNWALANWNFSELFPVNSIYLKVVYRWSRCNPYLIIESSISNNWRTLSIVEQAFWDRVDKVRVVMQYDKKYNQQSVSQKFLG